MLSGDGRHNSMGHSAKYCVYSMFCSSTGKIIHFDLIQVQYSGVIYGLYEFGTISL